jgi:hypothetical protein
MNKVSEYQLHAAECRALAGNAQTLDARDMLLRMAEAWETLAKDYEGRLAPKERIAALDDDPAPSK